MPWVRHWGFLEFPPHSVMSKRQQDFMPFPHLSPAPRYFHSAGWTHGHSNNYDEGNYCIFAHLSYLTMQKFRYNLDAESVPGDFYSRALTDISMIISPFLTRIVNMYCWYKRWQSSFFWSLQKVSNIFSEYCTENMHNHIWRGSKGPIRDFKWKAESSTQIIKDLLKNLGPKWSF